MEEEKQREKKFGGVGGKETASLPERNYRTMEEGLGKQSLSCSCIPGWAWARCSLEFIVSDPGACQTYVFVHLAFLGCGGGGMAEEFPSHSILDLLH